MLHHYYLLPTPRVDRYRGRSPVRMRPDDSFTWSAKALRRAWLDSDGSGRAGPPCRFRSSPGPRYCPRGPSKDSAEPGTRRRHGLLPPTALPCARPRVPGVSARFKMRARAPNWRATADGDQGQPGADSSKPALFRAEVPWLPLLPVSAPFRPEDRSTPKAPSVLQHKLSVPKAR
jgi:hypothetical protein